METFLEIVLIFFLMAFKGFFSGSEIAIVNSDKLKMRHLAKQGVKGAALVLKRFKTPDIILGTTLVGTNVATVAVSTITPAERQASTTRRPAGAMSGPAFAPTSSQVTAPAGWMSARRNPARSRAMAGDRP